jgi:hypothetical protein
VAGLTVTEFAVLRVPLHAPLAAQLVALLEDQASVAEAPPAIEAGVAVNVTAGGLAACAATPAASDSQDTANTQNRHTT